MSKRRAHRVGSPPRTVVVFAVAGIAFLVVPIVALIVRTPWAELGGLLTREMVVDALRISIVASVAATAISFVIGVPVAIVLARTEFPGKNLVRGFVLLPIVVPPVVGGAALLFAFGRRGVIGGPLYDQTGIVLPFSIWGVIMAVTFVAMPFVIVTVESGLRSLDTKYENAAATLGAGRWMVLRRVTLPLLLPSLLSGLALSWARAFGEFGATLTFAGNVSGKTQTMPLAVFVALESNREIAVAISLVMVAVALAVLLVLRDRWWRTP
ncbi:MAG: ABC transporter permease [Acidimicrobiia bacterium]